MQRQSEAIFHHFGDLQDHSAQHSRNAHDKGESDGELLAKAHHHAHRHGGARPGDARHGSNGLGQADGKGIGILHTGGILAGIRALAGQGEQDTGDDQAEAFHNDAVIGGKALIEVLEEYHKHQRQQGNDEQEDHLALGGNPAEGKPAPENIPEHGKGLTDQSPDGGEEGEDHCEQGSQMQDNGEKGAAFTGKTGEILEDGEMSRAGHRQKFGEPLDHSLQNCLPYRHKMPPYVKLAGRVRAAAGLSGHQVRNRVPDLCLFMIDLPVPAGYSRAASPPGDSLPGRWSRAG